MTKKIFILLISSLLLCSCGNIETTTATEAEEELSEITTETPTIANSIHVDTSDITYSGVFPLEMAVGYEVEGDAGQSIIQNFDEYTSPDGETFAFDEYKRLRYYYNFNCEDDSEDILSENEMQSICDDVLSDFIADYDKYECEESFYKSSDTSPYKTMMRYKTDSVSYGANIALTASGKVLYMNIYYYDIPDESQIDHEYFDTKFEEYVANVKANGDIHHYTLDNEYYYLRDNSVYALYSVTFYDNPISEESEEYPAFCESFDFAKSLE